VIIGRNEKLPGHPLVYATSKSFMDYFGINSPEDLPKLKEVFDESIVNPTIINDEAAAESKPEEEPGEEPPAEKEEASSQFVVREDGELIIESAAKNRDEENSGEEPGQPEGEKE
jgi:segregation and condensation protein B